ncbi:LacI family DNA-binding transcriptional regulator [Brassicibacter mesophilus]|uniref:LacI family DNA-binding transcriptional regulator n=1 Tax=Brassicibacter mesophilus TaxID=745119 RepID=UPI003D1C9749
MSNIRKVSQKVGVSVATVSRVLNHPELVSEDTRKKVLEAMRELDFVPNSVARSLAMNKTSTIGLVIPNILNPLYPKIAKGVEDVVYKKGYNILLSNTEYDISREKESIEMLLGKKVDGLIICSSLLEQEDIDKIKKQDTPIVFLGGLIEDNGLNIVYTDYLLGAYLAINHLINTGYRKIAYIGGTMNKRENIEKLKGYKKAMNESGIELKSEYILEAKCDIESGYLAFKKLLRLDIKPEAIFTANDLMAFGVIDAIKDLGYSVPDNFAVVGFDDISMSSLIEPKLTTVTHPVYRMGLTAARLLIDEIESSCEENFKQKIFIQPTLKIRKSCGHENRIKEIFS